MALRERAVKALKDVLDWGLVTNGLADRARSPLGRVLCGNHLPFASAGQSEWLRGRVAEGVILHKQSPLHAVVSEVVDPAEQLERASRGGVLDPLDLWACGTFFHAVGTLGGELRARKELVPLWAGDFSAAPQVPPLCERIRLSVNSAGEILDTASSELRRLRADRVAQRASFEASLENKLKDWHGQGYLQDKFYDVIDGRYVVPVKVEQQSKLQGALLGKSNTGQSVFVEPAEITGQNNALKALELAIRAEEFRILRELSAQVGALAPSFAPWVELIGQFDLALAAALLAKEWALSKPTVSKGELVLPELFHPGLKNRVANVVTNSLSLSQGGYGLLISGPNTGGKTVLLKAAGLAASMARAGLYVPAAEGSKVPHYAEVVTFIGDEQNIDAGLSSFSGQVEDLKLALQAAATPLLIIIDEMLSSTDPEEASALAQAVLEELVGRNHHALVTSHFSELSLRCKTNPKMHVAAMEFNDGRPTYRLRPDELGSSHALEIAERLGMQPDVIARARSLVSTAKLDYLRAQDELKKKETELEETFEKRKAQLAREFERKSAEITAKLNLFMESAQRRIAELTEELAKRVASYARIGERVKAAGRDAADVLVEQAKELEKEIAASETEAKGTEPGSAKPIAAGAKVRIRSMPGATGQVIEVRGKGSSAVAVLQVGNFKLEKPLGDVYLAQEQKTYSQRPHGLTMEFITAPPLKLDLRGKRLDEAMSEANRYLDQAFRSGLARVTVIPGHGTGAVKAALKDLLKSLPYVAEFKPERGNDDGALVVEFDL